jgi:hypothetical protein
MHLIRTYHDQFSIQERVHDVKQSAQSNRVERLQFDDGLADLAQFVVVGINRICQYLHKEHHH